MKKTPQARKTVFIMKCGLGFQVCQQCSNFSKSFSRTDREPEICLMIISPNKHCAKLENQQNLISSEGVQENLRQSDPKTQRSRRPDIHVPNHVADSWFAPRQWETAYFLTTPLIGIVQKAEHKPVYVYIMGCTGPTCSNKVRTDTKGVTASVRKK